MFEPLAIKWLLLPGLNSVVKNPPASAGDTRNEDLIPESGRSAGAGNGNPLQYSCLGNPMDRGAWWTVVHGVSKESDTAERLNKQPPDPHYPLEMLWRQGQQKCCLS